MEAVREADQDVVIAKCDVNVGESFPLFICFEDWHVSAWFLNVKNLAMTVLFHTFYINRNVWWIFPAEQKVITWDSRSMAIITLKYRRIRHIPILRYSTWTWTRLVTLWETKIIRSSCTPGYDINVYEYRSIRPLYRCWAHNNWNSALS